MATEISDVGLRLIAQFEGFASTPYNDPAGHCTVGYGFLLHFGNCTPAELAQTPISEEEGIGQLKEKVRLYVKEVVDDCRPLKQQELDALSSLCYNIGRSGFARSSVRVAVNNGGNVAGAFRQYVKGTNGVIYPGLVRRREAEIALFFSGEEPMTDAERADFAKVVNAVFDQARYLAEISDKLSQVFALGLRNQARLDALESKGQAVSDVLDAGAPANGP